MSLSDKNRVIRAIGKQSMSIEDISKIAKVNGETALYILLLYKEIFIKSKIKGQKQPLYQLTPYGLTLLRPKKEMPNLPPADWYVARINLIKDILDQVQIPLTTRQISYIIGKDRVHTFKLLTKNKEDFEQVGKSGKDSLWQRKPEPLIP